jgi:G3E family GTPase
MSTNRGAIRLTIVTGFLGSGKTSLLRRLLTHPALADTAVIINELGDVALDHLLVERTGSDIVLLDSGCICCAAEDDFTAALMRLIARRNRGLTPPFSRVIVETTGIADPGPVIQSIMARPPPTTRIEFNRVVTVVDALLGDTSLDAHHECIQQVVVADLLVLSKTAIAEFGVVERLKARLAGLAPGTPIVTQEEAARNPMVLFAQGGPRPVGPVPLASRHRADRHDRRYSTFTLTWDVAVSWTDFRAWLEGLLTVRGDDILRLKGLLYVEGETRPVVIQGVQHVLFPPERLDAWPRGRARTDLVFITRYFTREAARRSLVPFAPRAWRAA